MESHRPKASPRLSVQHKRGADKDNALVSGTAAGTDKHTEKIVVSKVLGKQLFAECAVCCVLGG